MIILTHEYKIIISLIRMFKENSNEGIAAKTIKNTEIIENNCNSLLYEYTKNSSTHLIPICIFHKRLIPKRETYFYSVYSNALR